MMKAAGINSLRDELGWGGVEATLGQYAVDPEKSAALRLAAELGVQPMLILDYANRHYDQGDRPRSPEALEAYTRYAEFLVKHFGSAVPLYEVWNEYDITKTMVGAPNTTKTTSASCGRTSPPSPPTMSWPMSPIWRRTANTWAEWTLRTRHCGFCISAWTIGRSGPPGQPMIGRDKYCSGPAAGQPLLVHRLGQPPLKRSWGYRDWAGRGGNNQLVPHQASLVVDHRPWLLRGELDTVELVGHSDDLGAAAMTEH